VSLPNQLRDKRSHGVADRHEAGNAEDVGECGDIIGTILEQHARWGDALPVASLVEDNHSAELAHRIQCRIPRHQSGASQRV
jgi:hypothetical protein